MQACGWCGEDTARYTHVLSQRLLVTLTVFGAFLLLTGSGCSRSQNAETHLARADQYYEARELEKAKIEYLNVLKQQPTNALALTRLGTIYFRQGQLREAYPLLVQARTQLPADLEIAQQLATIYLAGGDFAAARSHALAVLTVQPTNAAASSVWADAVQDSTETAAARQQIDRWQRTAGEHAVFHVARAQLARKAGDTKTVEDELQKALALDPRSIPALLAFGAFSWSQGATDQAELAFRTAAQLAAPDDVARLRLATFLLRTGRREEAKTILDEINRQAPERTAAWVLRAEIALAEKQLDECGQLLDRALGQAPGDAEAQAVLGQLRLAQNKTGEAVQIFRSLAESRPRSGEVHYQLGIAQLLNQQLPEAVASFTRAATLDPGNPSAALMAAELSLTRGHTGIAIDLLSDLVRRIPTLPRAQFLLARAYVAAGRTDDALALFRSMRARFPENAAVPFQLGLLLRQRQQPDEARKAFEDARRLAPDDLAPLEQLVDLALSSRAPVQALALLQPELDRHPTTASLWLLRARIDAQNQDKKGAEAALEKALELDPGLQAAYLMLADLYLKTGEPKESLSRLNELLKKNPSNISALMLSAMIQSQLGDMDEARKAYETVLKADPNQILALNNLAYLLADRFNRLEDAYAYARKAHQLATDQPSVADTLGWIEYRRGNYSEALRLLTEAREKLVGQPEVEAHFGLTAYMMGLEEPARKALTTALQSPAPFPGRDLAEQRLAILNLESDATAEAAIRPLEQRRKEDPNDVIAALRLGTAYETAGQPGKAIEAFEAVLKLNPNAPEAIRRLAALEVDRNPTRATELARQVQKTSPNDPDAARTLGRLALRSGDTATAFGLLQSSARQLTNQPAVWYDLAQAAFGSGRMAEAAEAARTAIRLGGSASLTNSAQWFLVMLAAGQSPEAAAQAQAQIDRALKADPESGPAIYAAALALEQQGKYAAARDLHQRLLQRYPTFTPSLRQLAILYGEHLNEADKAYEFATKARIALPKDDGLATTLGRLAFQRGDYRYAAQLFSEVTRSRPTDAEVQYQLGLTHLRLQQLSEGRAALEKAIALDPKATFVPEAQRILAENKVL